MERPRSGILIAYAFAVVTLVVVLVVLAIVTGRSSRALRALAAAHPDDRRLPRPSAAAGGVRSAVVPQGEGHRRAHRRRLVPRDGELGRHHGVDPRGRAAARCVLIEWAEIGDVLTVRTPTVGGDSRWSVTVDVKPYVSSAHRRRRIRVGHRDDGAGCCRHRRVRRRDQRAAPLSRTTPWWRPPSDRSPGSAARTGRRSRTGATEMSVASANWGRLIVNDATLVGLNVGVFESSSAKPTCTGIFRDPGCVMNGRK